MYDGYRRAHRLAYLCAVIFLASTTFGATKVRRINGMVELTDFGAHIVYVSPVPGSKYLTPGTNIIVRSDEPLSQGTVDQNLFQVVGSASGAHSGRVILTVDHQSVLFQPDSPFSLGETVSVSLVHPLMSVTGDTVSLNPFSFTISSVDLNTNQAVMAEFSSEFPSSTLSIAGQSKFTPQQAGPVNFGPTRAQGDTFPPDFPTLKVTTSDSPTAGYIFLATNVQPNSYGNYLIIADNNGNPVFYRAPGQGAILGFTIQPTGVLTYLTQNTNTYYVMNTSLQVIDSITAGNGYKTDNHELQILPDGNMFLIGDDYEQMNMSKIVAGGDTDATVLIDVVQELDKDKNVIFQWRTIDHFNITDAIGQNLTGPNVDPFHANSIQVDPDGNILLSCRHLSEITKINTQTGQIIWRLGGKNNQFTFVNDSIGFSYQHDIRRLANGDITLMDNGNMHVPPFSRAVEYKLDEVNKTATLVWQFRHSPSVYDSYMGNVQRLTDGNTIIGWGGAHTPTVTEVRPDGTTALEMAFPVTPNLALSYRAFRFPFIFLTSPAKGDTVQSGDSTTLSWMSSGVGTVDVDYSTDGGTTWTNLVVNYPAHYDSITVEAPNNPGSSLKFRVVQSGDVGRGVTYYSHTVAVAQGADAVKPGKTPYTFALSANYPNPFNPSTLISYELAAPAHVSLDVFNVLGQKVANLVDATENPGKYTLKFDGSGFASGVYFYRLKTSNGFVEVKKMVLEK